MIPQSAGQIVGMDIGELSLWVLDGETLQLLSHLILLPANPVDAQRRLVSTLCQVTRGITGQSENRRSTHAPMGDQQGS